MPLAPDQVGGTTIARYVSLGAAEFSTQESVVVNDLMSGRHAGGTSLIPGMVTSGSYNFVYPYDSDGNRIYGDTIVYGRLTVEQTTLTGTISVALRGTTVTGTGTAFLTELEVGCLIRISSGSEHQWARVHSISSDTSLTLQSGARFLASASAAKRGDWTVTLYTDGDVAFTHEGEVTIHALEARFPLDNNFIDSTQDPRLQQVGISWRVVHLTQDDFTYDAASGLSTADLGVTPPEAASFRGGMLVFVDGVVDTKRVYDTPDSDATTFREYRIQESEISIAGNFADGDHFVSVHFPY
jgi:hypothetical protein